MAARKTHEKFIQEFEQRGNKNVRILGNYEGDGVPMPVQCLIDQYVWNARPYNLLAGTGCPVCAGKAVMQGVNDLATERPDLVKYFVRPEDATKFTAFSNKKADLKCLDCGSIKQMNINALTQRGFSCSVCGDGVSFPNKFGRAMLLQLPLEYYESEWMPEWLKPYRYDHYFVYNNKQYVLEMDGAAGHGNRKFNSTEKDVQGLELDRIKDAGAQQNNVTVIRIDCKVSDSEYIIANLLDSKLAHIFDLSEVDWNHCEESLVKNLVKLVCDAYASEMHPVIQDIAKQYNLSRLTVRRYLKRGSKFGWCEYDAEKSKNNRWDSNRQKICSFDCQMDLICSYDSITQCAKNMSELYGYKFDKTNIARAAKSGKQYKGFYFKYA